MRRLGQPLGVLPTTFQFSRLPMNLNNTNVANIPKSLELAQQDAITLIVINLDIYFLPSKTNPLLSNIQTAVEMITEVTQRTKCKGFLFLFITRRYF
jgi:hypothetical protein